MALEQKYLNVTTRREGYMDIMMYVPDNNVVISNVSCNDVLSYSNLDSITDIKNYSSSTIATLEENLWLLNGAFINPTFGRKYNGYISNSISDQDGNFGTNPKINIDLLSASKVEYFSIILNPSVKSSYPKQVKLTTNNGNVYIKVISDITTLPNIIYELNEDNVSNVTLEFIGTQRANRRIRLANVMFGKVITLNQDDVISTDYLDKNSYVCDSIPTRTFTFNVNNYSKAYNIDNPNNSIIDLDRQTKIMIRNGYNVFGFNDETNEFDLDYQGTEIEWDDWKELRLLDVITNNDDTASFECGSILDMMTDTYTNEIFTNNRKVAYICSQLLNFMGLDTNTIEFSTDNNGKSYGDYEINVPLPQLPIRELIQLLAFSVGATILIKDNGIIRFANIDIGNQSSFTRTHNFEYKDFASVPVAQGLESTTKISLPKYNATIGDNFNQIFEITAYNTQISYQASVNIAVNKAEDDTSGGSIQNVFPYCETAELVCSLPTTTPLKVVVSGKQININQTQDRTITNDTLTIDTQLMKEDIGNVIKSKYTNWYSKKFKYTMETRGEPLVDAGDYAIIQSPFTDKLPAYVLQNHIIFDGSWSGDMEVIAL